MSMGKDPEDPQSNITSTSTRPQGSDADEEQLDQLKKDLEDRTKKVNLVNECKLLFYGFVLQAFDTAGDVYLLYDMFLKWWSYDFDGMIEKRKRLLALVVIYFIILYCIFILRLGFLSKAIQNQNQFFMWKDSHGGESTKPLSPWMDGILLVCAILDPKLVIPVLEYLRNTDLPDPMDSNPDEKTKNIQIYTLLYHRKREYMETTDRLAFYAILVEDVPGFIVQQIYARIATDGGSSFKEIPVLVTFIGSLLSITSAVVQEIVRKMIPLESPPEDDVVWRRLVNSDALDERLCTLIKDRIPTYKFSLQSHQGEKKTLLDHIMSQDGFDTNPLIKKKARRLQSYYPWSPLGTTRSEVLNLLWDYPVVKWWIQNRCRLTKEKYHLVDSAIEEPDFLKKDAIPCPHRIKSLVKILSGHTFNNNILEHVKMLWKIYLHRNVDRSLIDYQRDLARTEFSIHVHQNFIGQQHPQIMCIVSCGDNLLLCLTDGTVTRNPVESLPSESLLERLCPGEYICGMEMPTTSFGSVYRVRIRSSANPGRTIVLPRDQITGHESDPFEREFAASIKYRSNDKDSNVAGGPNDALVKCEPMERHNTKYVFEAPDGWQILGLRVEYEGNRKIPKCIVYNGLPETERGLYTDNIEEGTRIPTRTEPYTSNELEMSRVLARIIKVSKGSKEWLTDFDLQEEDWPKWRTHS